MLGVACGLLFVRAAAGQPVSTFEELEALETASATVAVIDENGREFRGTVTDVSEMGLALRVAGTIRQFAAGDIRSIRARKEDSLLNGALFGAAIAGGLTSLMFLDNECRDDAACYTAVGIYGGLGALAGLGIDALIHRSVVVYTAPARGARRVFTVAPFMAGERTGACLTIAF